MFASLACGCKTGKLSGKVRNEEVGATKTAGLTGQSSGGSAKEFCIRQALSGGICNIPRMVCLPKCDP